MWFWLWAFAVYANADNSTSVPSLTSASQSQDSGQSTASPITTPQPNTPTRTAIHASNYSWVDFTDRTSITSIYNVTSHAATLFPNMGSSDRSSLQSLFECDRALSYWEQNPGENDYTHGSEPTMTTTKTLYVYGEMMVSYPGRVTYTECDGVPRASWTGPPVSTLVTKMVSGTPDLGTKITSTETWFAPYPAPCTEDKAAYSSYCPQLLSLYGDVHQELWSAERQGNYFTYSALPQSPRNICTQSYLQCSLDVSSAHMNYWPAPPRPKDFCQSTTAPATFTNGSALVTAVQGNMTYTSPYVYITYYGIRYVSAYWSGYNNQTTTTYKTDKVVLSVHPTDVSSVCGPKNQQATFPFNFQDLQPPTPWSAYICNKACSDTPDACIPMDEQLTPHNPKLAWPQTFLSMLHSLNTFNPDSCQFGVDEGGIWDPPQMLTAAPGLNVPIVTKPHDEPKPSTTAADPITSQPPAPSSPVQGPAAPTTSAGPSPRPIKGPNSPAQGTPSPAKPVASSSPLGIGGMIGSIINRPPAGAVPSQGSGNADPGSPANPGRPGSPAAPANPADSGSPAAADPADPAAPANPASPGIGGIGGFIASMINRPPGAPAAAPAAQDPSAQGTDSPPKQALIPVAGGSIVTVIQAPNGANVVAGTTHFAGEAAVVAGQTLSFRPDGVVVLPTPGLDGRVGAGEVVLFSAAPASGSQGGGAQGSGVQKAVVSVGGTTMTAERVADGTVVMDGKSYKVGDAVSVGGESMEIRADGVVVRGSGGAVVSSAAFMAQGSGMAVGGGVQRAVVSVDGKTMTAERAGDGTVVMGGKSYNVGDVVTVGGETMEIRQDGIVLKGAGGFAISTAAFVAMGAQAAPTVLAVAGQQITYGAPAKTVAGKRVSYGAQGLIIGTETEAVPTGTSFITLDDGEVLRVGVVTRAPGAEIGGMVGSLLAGSGVATTTGASATRNREASETSRSSGVSQTGLPSTSADAPPAASPSTGDAADTKPPMLALVGTISLVAVLYIV
ncbi:hypothetical protein C1H76_7461 [Elsinoe australis]|uniref:Uncharacterized protein n=1 Tax=Elsinoe australis TaxID=40998 RepID=A0A4U7AZ65_9PEZI|nr:hypothetical protein C1H76_7461 [Elsinoe australis]